MQIMWELWGTCTTDRHGNFACLCHGVLHPYNKTLSYIIKLYVDVLCNYSSRGRGIWEVDLTRTNGNKGFHFPLLYLTLLS